MEPQRLQHLHEFDPPQVVQFAHLIWQLHDLHENEKKSHGCANVNPFLIQGLSSPSICKLAKDLLTFHMCDSNFASQPWGIFQNCIYKLLWILKLGCYMQE
jgi:hypothetical protein